MYLISKDVDALITEGIGECIFNWIYILDDLLPMPKRGINLRFALINFCIRVTYPIRILMLKYWINTKLKKASNSEKIGYTALYNELKADMFIY